MKGAEAKDQGTGVGGNVCIDRPLLSVPIFAHICSLEGNAKVNAGTSTIQFSP